MDELHAFVARGVKRASDEQLKEHRRRRNNDNPGREEGRGGLAQESGQGELESVNARFQAAVDQLTRRLASSARAAAVEGGGAEIVFYDTTVHTIDVALAGLCPLWPFC